MDSPRPAHYSFSASQLSSAVNATTSTVYLASSPSSSCSVNLSDVDDSTFYGSTHASQPFPANARVPSETSTERRSCASSAGSSRKRDDEAYLTYFDVGSESTRRWRDVLPGGRAANLICISVLAVVCCVLASRLLLEKVSALRLADAIVTLDSINETKTVLVRGVPVEGSRLTTWTSPSLVRNSNASRQTGGLRTKEGVANIGGASEKRNRGPAFRRYHPVTRPKKMPEQHLSNTSVVPSSPVGGASARIRPAPHTTKFDDNPTYDLNIIRPSPQTTVSAWLKGRRSATTRHTSYTVYIKTDKPTSLPSTLPRAERRSILQNGTVTSSVQSLPQHLAIAGRSLLRADFY
ncbi:uncharacterized protein [Dermacentor albipictus]|uniref:uncharacterized protein n=1 Tax=Dermacentor albipictus TaxID=60249 RepID=UPI0031FDF795